jgi:SSS family solute:Na+ symporter
LPAFVATLVATWYGGILGVGEYCTAMDRELSSGVPYYVGAPLFALLFARRARTAALYTLPDLPTAATVAGRRSPAPSPCPSPAPAVTC